MTSQREGLPPVSAAGEFAAGISQLVRPVLDLPYGGQAAAEIEADDRRLSSGIVQNPVMASHEIAGIYLNGAGEALHTLSEVLLRGNVRGRQEHPVAAPYVSTAPLARTALEYSAKAWWLQRPSDTARIRAGRALGAMRGDFTVRDAGEPGDPWGKVGAELERWASGQPFRVTKGEGKITAVIREMDPVHGEDHYGYLSDVTHGGPTTVLRIFGQTQAGPMSAALEQWARTLIAARAVTTACRAVADLRGAQLPPPWNDVIALGEHYAALWSAEYDAALPDEHG